MIKSYICTNISSKNNKNLVEFYHYYLEIPIIFDGYGDYDGNKIFIME